MLSTFILILSAVVIFILYLFSKRNHDYWKKKGIKYEEPTLLFGGSLKQYTDKVSLSGRFANLYRKYPKEKYVGFFQGNQQGLLLREPELIKHVLQTDFRKFHCRGVNFYKEPTEILAKNLFNADGDIWKLMRQKLTPAFSSGKLKAMFPLIVERAEKLLKIADGLAETGDEVDARELMARYTTDFIGACGFGIDADTLNDESSDFRKLGKQIFTISKKKALKLVLKAMAPYLFKSLRTVEPEVENQLVNLVKQIMSQRNYVPSGFETSSTSSSFMLHLLAYNPEEQLRCQQEVDKVLEKYNGKLNYDAVKEMKYLEMAFKEALRIFPSPGIIVRKNVTEYTFPGTELTIDEGTLVYISTEALQSDETYFEEPEKFRPQRFHPDSLKDMNKYVYMPFGEGPRACIGERMGIMQSLAGVAAILSKFSVSPSRNSVLKPRIDPKSSMIQLIIGGLPLSLKRRQRF